MIEKQIIYTDNTYATVVGSYLRRSLSISMLIVLSLILSAIGVTPVHATTLVVMNTNDGGPGSLRDTIATAGIGDTITFDASLSGGTVHLASTLILTQNINIDGSALTTKITLSGDSDNNGTNDVRVFQIKSGVTVVLDSLTITSGKSPLYYGTVNSEGGSGAAGGGIENEGILTVTNSTISNNLADSGAGIMNIGTLSLINSMISGNSATSGGGIYTDIGTLTVSNSTITGNSATAGAGIYNYNGTLTVRNSTIYGNTAAYFGGGIYNRTGTVTVTNSTIAGNAAVSITGGGIYNYMGGVLTVTNSTISGNSTYASGAGIDNNGILNYSNTIVGNSIGGIAECVNSNGGTINTNLNNLVEDGSCSAAFSGDPNLAPRASNGGPTQTLALWTGSTAIDAGDDMTCTNSPVNGLDQRGITRPVGTHCDIGAYEGEVAAPPSMTFTSIAGQDGWVLESSENSGLGGSNNATATTLRLGDDATKKQYRNIVSFDTSGIPDTATILGVTLKMKQQGMVGTSYPITDFNGLMVDIKNGFFGAHALQVTDFQATASKTLGPIIIRPVNGVYNININLTNGKTAINKLSTNGGLTQIRLRLKLDDNNDAIANYLSLYSSNAGAAANRPQLVIVYTP